MSSGGYQQCQIQMHSASISTTGFADSAAPKNSNGADPVQSLRECEDHHPDLRIRCVVADALLGTAAFVDAAAAIFDGVS
jgi:hypothetical protein